MPVSLPRTDAALAECRAHLDAVSTGDIRMDTSAVSAYLASHIAIVLCAEVEDQVTSCFDELIDAAPCSPTVIRLAKARKGQTRSAKVKDIGDALERLGAEIRQKFDNEVQTRIGDEGVARIGNIVGARDSTSHRTNAPQVTFGDLELARAAAAEVLEAVRLSLSLPSA